MGNARADDLSVTYVYVAAGAPLLPTWAFTPWKDVRGRGNGLVVGGAGRMGNDA